MKKILVLLIFSVSFLFGAMNLQSASKEELMSIKGIGSKKADAIIKYRKTNRIKSADDLKNIKGFGKKIIANVKGNVTNKKSAKGESKKGNSKNTKDEKKSNKKGTDKKLDKDKSKKKKENKKDKKKKKSDKDKKKNKKDKRD